MALAIEEPHRQTSYDVRNLASKREGLLVSQLVLLTRSNLKPTVLGLVFLVSECRTKNLVVPTIDFWSLVLVVVRRSMIFVMQLSSLLHVVIMHDRMLK